MSTLLRKYTGIILLLAVLGLIVSCRSSRTGDAGFLKRTYHNITARYNGYFNARQIFNETVTGFGQAYIDSYDQLLPVVKFPSESQGQDLAAPMGTVIAKASEVIDRHEVSRWTDDAYLMIGKANFYRRDFHNALLSLQYVYNEYEDNDIKQESLAWIGLSNMLQEKYQDAETAFDIALSNIDSSESAAPFIYASAAQFNINRERFNLAIPLLESALRSVKKKEQAIRYAYVLGQLHEREGRSDSAIAYYNRVIAFKPPYEIIFNTKLSIARLYSVSAAGGENIEEELWNMMQDEKNKDYIDQLYYVLGTIAEKKNDIPEAINYYTLSAGSSTVNKNQKGVAYLGIAEIWFNAGDYDKARLYYDSTMASLSANYPGYDDVLYKSGKLRALSENARIIRREDSLQHLAVMPSGERMKVIDKALKDILAARAEEKKLQDQAAASMGSRGRGSTLTGRIGAGSWYFYNTAALSQGYSEFLRRWSNRPNENNWRRSNKQSLAGMETGGSAAMSDAERVSANDPEVLKEELLSGIPFEPAQLDSSNFRIIEAYYTIAGIYENNLEEPGDAIRYYEELMKRFPGNRHTPAVYYSLYKLYQGNDPQKSETYKNLVLNEYPGSDYALVINNPGSVLARQAQSDSRLGQFYAETYRLFREGQFTEVIQRSRSPEITGAQPVLAAKFALLEALAVGRSDSIPRFTASLEKVSSVYPQEDPGRTAQAWLSYVNANPAEFSGRMPVLVDGGSWLTDFEAVQRMADEKARREAAALARAREEAERNSYFKIPVPGETFTVVIAVSDPALNLNSTRFGLGQLNRRFYSTMNYRHDLKTVNNEMQLLSVGPFENFADARQYYETLQQYRNSIIKAPGEKTEVFYMTSGNFARLLNAGNVREYRYYFRANFLSGKQRQLPDAGQAVPELSPEEKDVSVADSALAAVPAETAQDEAAPAETVPAETAPPVSSPSNALPAGFSPGAEDSRYLLVVAVNDGDMNLNSTRLGIGLFNRGYYRRMDYKHNSKTINNEIQLISVTIFNSREEANRYYRAFMDRRAQIVKAPEGITDVFLVTRDNFLLLDSQQIVEEYVNYFNSNYRTEHE